MPGLCVPLAELTWCTRLILLIKHRVPLRVPDLNATDKTPMYEMQLILCLGVAGSIFVLGFWAMAFFHWPFVLRSLLRYYIIVGAFY